MKNYLELDHIGTIAGIKVQCLPVSADEYERWKDKGICEYYNCALNGKDCEDIVMCMAIERADETEVYFKKVE